MREFVRLLVLLAVGGGAYTLWRLYSYPGGWAYAFHPRHAADRNDLDKARRPARDLTRERKKELAAAHTGIERADRRHRAVVRSIEREIHHLRHPGRGQEVAELGGLTLHQHAVIKDDREIPLQGLAIHLEHAQQQDFIHRTPTDGDPCHTSYPHAEHDADDVRRFAVQLENAVAEERSHRARTDKTSRRNKANSPEHGRTPASTTKPAPTSPKSPAGNAKTPGHTRRRANSASPTTAGTNSPANAPTDSSSV